MILSSRIRPEGLSRDELVAELNNRRIQIPFGANDQFLRHILSNALVSEQDKAPIKFPFGVRTLSLEDLDDLPPVVIKTMLVQAHGQAVIENIALNNMDLLLGQLRATILQQDNNAYVTVIRGLLKDMKQMETIESLDKQNESNWRGWFCQLERCIKSMNDDNNNV
jgi:hypothetical protein